MRLRVEVYVVQSGWKHRTNPKSYDRRLERMRVGRCVLEKYEKRHVLRRVKRVTFRYGVLRQKKHAWQSFSGINLIFLHYPRKQI